MLYDIRWFDTTKTGKLIIRKYQGKIPEYNGDSYMVLYNGRIKFIPKANCIANVWKDGRWQPA